MDLRPHIERFSRRFAEVEAALSDPKAFDNPQRAQELGREYARLKDLVACGGAYLQTLAHLDENRALLQTEAPDSEMAALAKEEIARLEADEKKLAQKLQFGLVPPNPADSRNTIIEIRAGAGGSESALFAADLYRMYSRYAEAQGRIHTSTATVAVLPEAEEVDIEIKPDELEINVCRASGKGGQGVNTTDSAVQIQHKPTGLIVRCADERSQIKNRAKAMTVLRSRLLERKVAEENAKYAAQRKEQVGTGERNERIRTYNFPQNRVTDHRIELTLYNLPTFIYGEIDPVIEPLMSHDLEEKLLSLK